MSQQTSATPIASKDRIVALDVLRGFAILGILLMNIQSFAMVEAAYLNPAAYGDLTGINKWVWILSHIFADQKFMTIFSLLFGAGIVLFTSRIEAQGGKVLGLHYRRTFWLLIIGLLHAYLLWFGDILVTYAICALVVVLFRKWSPRVLLLLGLVVMSVVSLIYLLGAMSIPYMTPADYEGLLLDWQPTPEMIRHEVAVYQSGWFTQMTERAPTALESQTFVFLVYFMWRAGGLMLIGMALFKWGVLTAQRSTRFYAVMTAAGLGLGLPLVILGVAKNFAANWALDYSMFSGVHYNYWGSVLVSMGYIGGVILLTRRPIFNPVGNVLAAVGRMALTNYLLQTVICTFIFYGHGLGLFGQVERSGQIIVVAAVWAIQLIVSPLWLRRYRFGPIEWLWRSLTYWKLQPLKRGPKPK